MVTRLRTPFTGTASPSADGSEGGDGGASWKREVAIGDTEGPGRHRSLVWAWHVGEAGHLQARPGRRAPLHALPLRSQVHAPVLPTPPLLQKAGQSPKTKRNPEPPRDPAAPLGVAPAGNRSRRISPAIRPSCSPRRSHRSQDGEATVHGRAHGQTSEDSVVCARGGVLLTHEKERPCHPPRRAWTPRALSSGKSVRGRVGSYQGWGRG